MKKRVLLIVFLTMLGFITVFGFVSADDGVMLIRNLSKTPETETEKAGIAMMNFYVPAQASSGALTEISYQFYSDHDNDPETEAVLVEEFRNYAKPLVTFFVDGIEEEHSRETSSLNTINSGLGMGSRDSIVALSLDDGVSWKRMNVSNAAHLSSFTLANGHEYPGDSYAGVVAVAGDRVLAAWLSRYCMGGTPAYAMLDVDDVDGDGDVEEDLYPDYFGVAGSQGSVDYTLTFPEVGEIPYGCVWTSRGQLLYNEGDPENETDPILPFYEIVWTKAERLTSGRRDANRLEIAGVDDAGFAIVWQEDPQGLRPGSGLGPGEGWSGAIVNAKTDIWYSYIGWEEFDQVWEVDPEDDTVLIPVPLSDFTGDEAPKVASPMVMPVRVSDNNMCQVAGDGAVVENYCFTDFGEEPYEEPYTMYVDETYTDIRENLTFCEDYVAWSNPGGAEKHVCATKDGRVLLGRVGASRPRIGMHPYTYTAETGEVVTSAWVLLGYEETKALGEGTSDENIEDAAAIDIGKNMWYHSFDMAHPDFISHGNMLNQPAMDPLSDPALPNADRFFPIQDSADAGLDFTGVYDQKVYTYTYYETEITRRFSLISQPASNAGDSGVVAFALVKQGIINQGGPADIYGRAFAIPDEFDPEVDNPYAFENMVCDEWAFDDDSNPFYPKGICLDTPPNISGTEAVACEVDGAVGDCPTLEDVYVYDDVSGEWGFELGAYERVIEWDQIPASEEYPGTLSTQSWHNPFDIAKGHRGFLDGDFLMVLYAWSPNYKENAVGHDHYNLYIRRSFDGGLTWTTTPAEYTDENVTANGTTTCEQFGWGSIAAGVYQVCTDYGAGEFEKSRNVSQLVGSQDTILDPRYTPTTAVTELCMDEGELLECTEVETIDELPYTDDSIRDRSRYFAVYETGDNTTVMLGEATPQDLFYSRAFNWGDDYDVITATIETYVEPFELETWDWLEHGADESGEAGITTNASGSFFYAAWNQALEIGNEEFTNMDAYFRRVMYDDGQFLDAVPAEPQDPEAVIVSTSSLEPTIYDELLIIGSAVDGDYLGGLPEESIVEYLWTHTFDGITTVIEDDDGDPRTLRLPAGRLFPGHHIFGFRARDNEGTWSPTVSVDIQVIQQFRIYIPVYYGP